MFTFKKGGAYDDLNYLSTTPDEILSTTIISDATSTIKGYNDLIEVLSQQSSFAYSNLQISTSNYTTEMTNYDESLSKYSTDYTKYICSVNSFEPGMYEHYSTIEHLSLARYVEEYTLLSLSEKDSFLSTLQLNEATIYDAILHFSTVNIPADLSNRATDINTLSSMISYYTDLCASDSDNISTLISTMYNPWHSTMMGLSTQLSTAVILQEERDIAIENATSIYNHYFQLQQDRISSYNGFSGHYNRTLDDLKIQSVICSTAQELYDFKMLQNSIMNAETLFNSTMILKSELDEMIQLRSQGVDITNYFKTVSNEISAIQRGGATSSTSTADQLSQIIQTVDVLYLRYSTMVTTLTAQQSALYPNMTADQVESYQIQTGFKQLLNQYNETVRDLQEKYEATALSTNIISKMISTNNLEYSTFMSTGVVQAKNIDAYLSQALQNYSSILKKKTYEYSSTQQQLYLYQASSLKIEENINKNQYIISDAVRQFTELGGSFKMKQSGGDYVSNASTNNIIQTYNPDLWGPKDGGGQLQDLYERYEYYIEQINSVSSIIQQMSTGSLTFNDGSLSQIIANINTQALYYNNAAFTANVNISTQLSSEINNYIYTLRYISTILVSNLLTNTINSERAKHERIEDVNLSTLSTSSGLTRPIIKANNTFITMLAAELFVKKYYIQQKTQYEKQMYYRIILAKPDTTPDLMSSEQFDTLTTLYDLSIQNVNRYVNNRENYYNNFVNTLGSMITTSILDQQYIENLKSPQQIFTDPTSGLSTSYIISPILPLTMKFDPVPFRVPLFQGSILPRETLAVCSTVSASSRSIVQDLIPFNIASIQPKTVPSGCGIQGRFVKITRPDNNVEILQILVIDSTGKNVAHGGTVTAPSMPSRTADLQMIVNGNYDINTKLGSFISGPTEGTVSPGNPKSIWIDLGSVCDITAVEYLKNAASTYNSSGFVIQIYASNQITPVGSSMLTVANTPNESIDFRVKTIDPVTQEVIPMFLTSLRKGVCGVLARYIILLTSSSKIFQISQVAVISSSGDNIALKKTATYINGPTSVNIPLITDGTYHSRDASSCFVKTNVPTEAHIQIDLGSEQDVTAVHLYNMNTGQSYQYGTLIDLYTADRQLAIGKTAITNNMKEIIDFRFPESDVKCPVEMNWPSFYGSAGIISQFVGLRRTDSSALGFSKIQIIDKSGRDVGLYKPTSVSSNPSKAYQGVTNYVGPQLSSMSYVSNAGANQRFLVDLQQTYEICAINVFACSDAPNLLQNTVLEFYPSNPMITAGVSSFYTQSVSPKNLSSFFDTRYDPEDSSYNTTIDTSLTSYGSLGTLGMSASIPGINVTGIQIVEGTGHDLYPSSIVTTSNNTTKVVFSSASYLYEIISIIIIGAAPALGSFVIIYGCDGVMVNSQPLQNYTDPGTGNQYKLADFRSPSKSPYAPMYPLPMATYANIDNTISEYENLTAMYSAINPDTGKNNMPPKGVLTRYVKVIPRDATTPLYISQIVVVDSNGINVAFQRDTFTPNSALLSRTAVAVDGVFALSYDDPNFSWLHLADYVSRPMAVSFVSAAGPQESNYYVIDLGMNYFVNSVIYVSASGKDIFDLGRGVIVELYNANLVRIGVKMVSKYVSLFGVDVLDFRVDKTELVTNPGAWLEVRPRVVQLGPIGCGIMGQYIRIMSSTPGTPFTLSQLIVTDSNGNNVALYKPTYSSTSNLVAYKIVDGTYYQRQKQYAYKSEPVTNGPLDYIEVNFENELEIVNLFVVNTEDNTGYSSMVIKVYNAYRDIIATLKMGNNPDYSSMIMNGTTFSLPTLYVNNQNTLPVYNTNLPVLGVNVLTKLAPFSIASGLTPPTILPPPDAVAIQTINTFPMTNSCTPTPASLANLFTRGASGGIPGRYVRIYNVDDYIQVSQIMAYGPDGTNYAYKAKCIAKSVFPGTYVDKVTDGTGGYFHSGRTTSDCYKSEGTRYDYLQVDLGAEPLEIIGVRCVFASDNQSSNVGVQIQIISDNAGKAGAVLAQHVTTASEYSDVTVDFRPPPISSPISQMIMPKISTVPSLPSGIGGPNGVVDTADGTIYVVDSSKHCIWSSAKTTPFFGTAGSAKSDLTGLNTPVGIVTDGTHFYVSDSGNDRILRISAATATATLLFSPLSPYGLFYANGYLYVATNTLTGQVHYYNIETKTATQITPSMTIPFPNSIVLVGSYYYVSSSTTGTVYQVSTTSPYTTSAYVGYTATSTKSSILSVAAITYDSNERVLFIADFVQDKIFALQGLGGTPTVTALAGTGTGGEGGDGAQGIFATMDGPISVYYSSKKGYLYISDYRNKTVRYLQMYSSPSKVVATTTLTPTWSNWTTTTYAAGTDTLTTSQPLLTQPTPVEFTQITAPSLISNVLSQTITAFYITGSTAYYVTGTNVLYSADGGTFPGTAITLTPSTTFGKIVSMTSDTTYLYLCDTTNNFVYRVSLSSPHKITTYIGSGATVNATLKNPTWIGFDKITADNLNGTLYISDTGNYCIRRLNGLSKLETYVGKLGTQGTTVPIAGSVYGINANLNKPSAFVFDSNNNLIFVDSGSNTVYKVAQENRMTAISPNSALSAQSGGAPSSSSTSTAAPTPFLDSLYKQSSFPISSSSLQLRTPYGITIDSADSLYITAQAGQQIAKFTINNLTGLYTTSIVAGFGSDTVGRNVSTDTNAYYASLNGPTIIQYDNKNSVLYFVDASNNILRKITPQTVASYPINTVIPYGPLISIANDSKNTYNTSASSGTEEKYGILLPFQANFVCTSTTGTLYFTHLSTTVVSLDVNGNITTVATGNGWQQLEGIALYNDSVLYVADYNVGTIKSIVLRTKVVSTTVNNITKPYSLAINPIGYLFYSYSNTMIGIYNLKTSTVLTSVSLNLTSTTTVLISINAMTTDTDGNLYVSAGVSIYKYVITYTNSGPTFGTQTILVAYGGPFKGLAYSGGKLFYSSSSTNAIYSFIQSNTSSTNGQLGTSTMIVGQQSIQGPPVDGGYSNSVSLNGPLGICIDANQTLYALDKKISGNTLLLKNTMYNILQQGSLYTVSGSSTKGTSANYVTNQPAYFEIFNKIGGVCYDSQGQIYVSDTNNHCISMIDPYGKIKTFAGTVGQSGYSGDNGAATSGKLDSPRDIKMSKSNVLYVADTGNDCIRRVKRASIGYNITTFATSITGPITIAIDSNENVYVSNGTQYINKINVVGQMVSLNIGAPTVVVNAIAVDNQDTLYYINDNIIYYISYDTNNNLETNRVLVSGLTLKNVSGMIFDASNNLYISNTDSNYIYLITGLSSSAPSFTTIIGNGVAEPTFTIGGSGTTIGAVNIPQNIYGSGVPSICGIPPMEQPITSPGALALDPVKGLLIAQPTKVKLYNLSGASSTSIKTTSITITNNNSVPIYLSQIVVINNKGLNCVLGTTGYQDGFYGCKMASAATTIAANTNISITVNDIVVLVLLYPASTGKANWNGATVALKNSDDSTNTRKITGVSDTPSMQYILFDYRVKNSASTPYVNYINKYKTQDTSTAITTTTNQYFMRYIYVTLNSSSPVSLSQIAVIHAETGANLALTGIASSSSGTTPNLYANGDCYVKTNPVSSTDTWVIVDLGDEYPVEQVILYSNLSNAAYNVYGFTNSRLQIVPTRTIKSGAFTTSLFSQNTGQRGVRYIKYVNTTSTKQPIIYPVQISQIIAIDTYGINVAYNKTVSVFSTKSGTTASSVVSTGLLEPSSTPYISNGSSTSEYLQIDLGREYDIVQIIYVNSSTNPLKSKGCTVNLIDSSNIILTSYSILGTKPTSYSNPGYAPSYKDSNSVEAYSFRTNSTASLKYSSTTSLDSVLRAAVRARYVRFENPTGRREGVAIRSVAIYDMYGKNISSGKITQHSNPIPPTYSDSSTNISISPPLTNANSQGALSSGGYLTSGVPGDWWEVDCGQVYSVRDVVVTFSQTSISVPYVLYDAYRTEVFRGFTTENQTIPFPLYTNPTNPALYTQLLKYVRITQGSAPSPAFNLTHLAIIDSRGMDVSPWRPVKMTDAGGTVTYTTTLDGRYTTSVPITKTWQINLVSTFKIYSIICYGKSTSSTTTNGSKPLGYSLTFYDGSEQPILSSVELTEQCFSSSGQLIKLDTEDTSIFTSVQNTIGYGVRTRYITIDASSNSINFRAIAAIDSLGRNVAYNCSMKYGTNVTAPPTNLVSFSQSLGTSSIKIDLGQEYFVAFVIIYYPTTADTSLDNATLKTLDALNNVTRTATLKYAGVSTYYTQAIDLTVAPV